MVKEPVISYSEVLSELKNWKQVACGYNFNIEYGFCYNIRCEKYLRNNKQLFNFDNNEYYSVPVVKRLILSEKEALQIEDNIKSYERITKL
jgi:hypothetical protein